MLRKVHGRWALVSKSDPSKVLQYYRGPHDQKPSDEWVSKVERRVHGASAGKSHVAMQESANQPYAWAWKDQYPSMYIAEFTTRNQDIVEFKAYRDRLSTHKSWEIYFTTNDSYTNTMRHDALRVLATIVDIMRDLVMKTTVDIMHFAAMEPNRFRVYRMLANKFSNNSQYQVITNHKQLKKIDPTLASEGIIAICRNTLVQQPKQVLEAFDKIYNWQWTKQSQYRWTADFTTRDHDIIKFNAFDETYAHNDPDTWSIEFRANNDYAATGRYDLSVLSTVIDIARNFVRSRAPQVLVFTAIGHRRFSLYMRIIHRLIKEFDYQLVQDRQVLQRLGHDDGSTVVLLHNSAAKTILESSMVQLEPWSWTTSSGQRMTAEFQTQDHGTVTVEFTRGIELRNGVNVPTWHVQFLRDGHTHISSRGDAASMFKTIESILDAFVGRFDHAPKHLVFLAREPSRREMYRQLVEKFAENYGYIMELAGADQLNLDQPV